MNTVFQINRYINEYEAHYSDFVVVVCFCFMWTLMSISDKKLTGQRKTTFDSMNMSFCALHLRGSFFHLIIALVNAWVRVVVV